MIASYSPHTVRRCSGDQNFRDRHILQRQPDEVSRIGCQAGMRVHQHSDAESAHSNGTAQLAQRFSMGRSGERANRQRVALSVHRRFSTISWPDISSLQGGLIGRRPHFLTILPFGKIVSVFDA